jgi:HEAT repeat protein
MYWTKWITVIAIAGLLSGCGGGGSSPSDDPASDAAQSPGEGTDGADSADVLNPPDNTASGPTNEGRDSPSRENISPVAEGPSPAPSPGSDSGVSLRNCLIDLNSDDLRVRGRGLDLLEKQPDAVAQSIHALKNESADVRRGAAFFLLGKFDAGNSQVDQALIGALTDEDAGVRRIALQAVNELQGNAVLPATGQLARMLANPQEDKHIRAQIARRLGRLESGTDKVLPTLKQLGRTDPDRDVRAACLYAFYKTAGRDEAIPLFREVLREETDAGLRGVAASRLGSFGTAAAPAVPDLATALDADEESSVRGKVAEALARIGTPAVPTLVERFHAKDREVRILAIFGVGRMGSAAAQAIPQLEKLLKDEDRDVRLAAELSLRRLQGLP